MMRMQMIEKTVNAERIEQLIDVFGSFDENIKRIESEFGVRITNRGTELKVQGDIEAADQGARALEALLALAAKGEEIDEQKVRYILSLVRTGNEDEVSKMAKDVVCVSAKGRPIKAKTIGQQKYLKAIEKNTVTIGVGPAGTGKTYLAVAEAVAAFRAKEVNRIILTRPAVEAGERLGFLPGDLQNKVDPYLRPLYDALQEMFGLDAKDAALRLAEDFGIRVDDHWTPPKERKPTAFDLERALEARRSAEWSKLCSAVHRANAILAKYDAHPESAWDSKEFITALQARTAANERLDWLWSATLADLALEYREEKQCERRRAPSAGGADGGRPGDSGAGGDGAQTPAAGSPCASGGAPAAGAASVHAASAGTAEAGILLGGEPVRTHH